MKRFTFLFFTILFAGCSTHKHILNNTDKCNLIQAILDTKEINKMLGIDKAKEVYPYIRIYDIKKKLPLCQSFYVRENPKLVISYFVLHKLSYNLNTGYFRDLIVLDVEKQEDNIFVNTVISNYRADDPFNDSYYVDIHFVLKEGKYVLQEEKIRDWIYDVNGELPEKKR